MEHASESSFPLHLRRTDANEAEIAALTTLLGGAAGLAGVLDNLKYRARHAVLPGLLGRAVSAGIRFDRYDQADQRWWPQGISSSADASATGVVCGDRRVLVTTWYAKPVTGVHQGSRVTFLDLDTLKYRHVLLVDAHLDENGALALEPVRIHAGGIVWHGPWLHIAATGAGFVTCHIDDILRVAGDDRRPDDFGVQGDGKIASFGHRYVLPVRFRYRAYAHGTERRLRYSFLSLDRSQDPPVLLAGEYGRTGQSTRIARYPLDPDTQLLATDHDGRSHPAVLEDGVNQMQGVLLIDGTYYASVSQGPWMSGAMYVGPPGQLAPHSFALPMGPEDLSYWPSADTIWSISEHPRRRWIFAVRRQWFDQARPTPWVPRRLPSWLRPLADRLLLGKPKRD